LIAAFRKGCAKRSLPSK
jgi:hypothetical protein